MGGAHMKVEVLGPGCMKCQALLRNVEQVLAQSGIQAEVVKVTDEIGRASCRERV